MKRHEAKQILKNIEIIRAFAEGKTLTSFGKELNDPDFQGDPDTYTIVEPKPERVKVVYYRVKTGRVCTAIEGSSAEAEYKRLSDHFKKVEIEA